MFSRESVATMIPIIVILTIGFRGAGSGCISPSCRGIHLSAVEDYDLNQTVPEGCNDNECLILNVITLLPNSWTAFCMDNEKVLYAFWDCNRNPEFVYRKVKFRCYLNPGCDSPVECDHEKYVLPCSCDYDSTYCVPKDSSTDQTSSGTTEISTTEGEASVSTSGSDDNGMSTTTTTATTEPDATSACERGLCFDGECFFRDHCYFFRDADPFASQRRKDPADEAVFYGSATTETCAAVHPSALGAAVETDEENEFVKSLVRQRNLELKENRRILTSGIKREKAPGEWWGWNSKLNETILHLETSPSSFLEYVALRENSGILSWYYQSPTINETITEASSILCERPYEDFIIWPDHLEECEKTGKGTVCSGRKHCCGIDESGTLWFGCSNLWTVKPCEEGESRHRHRLALWYCDENGHFATEFPYDPGCDCRKCDDDYQGFRYRSCYNKTAIGGCLDGTKGYSKRFCDENRDPPDFGACCEEKETPCRDVDQFFNVWVSCPSKTVEKITPCPEGSFFETAPVRWRCGENGIFDPETPNYEACYCPAGTCRGTDKYLREWKACAGDVAQGKCPEGFPGTASWKCGIDGTFLNSEPDFSRCRPPWIDEIQNEIEAGTDSVFIMDSIGNHTKDDGKIGFGDIVRVTTLCIELFENQSSLEDTFDMLEDFATSYSDFLADVLTDTSVWSDFTLDDRLTYAQNILQMTEKVAFSKLNRKNEDSQLGNFNKTFKDLEKSGLEFFITYGQSPEGATFLARSSKKWSVKIKSVQQERGNNFAAVGLVFEPAVGALMFPNGNETLKKRINAPIISFSVASRIKGSLLKLSNVTVNINFKHLRKARRPPEILVRRRLHREEVPSEVYGSSLCYYYALSDWNREGCSLESYTEYETNCRCTHLSTISVLMDLHEYVPEPTVELVSMICSGVSIVALFLTLTVFFGFESIKGERTTIGKHLCFCLLIGHVMLLTVVDKKFFNLNDEACSVVAVVLHYVFMAAFFWMSIEGHHLYRLVVLVFESDTDYKTRYLLIGYGIPVFVVGLTQMIAAIYDDRAYGQDELCWLQTPGYVWAFVGPVVFITTFNLFVLTVAMRLAVVAKTGDGKSNLESIKLWLKGWFSLSTLLGVTWLIGLGYIQYNYFFVYGFVVLNGLQGLFIFLFRCVLNDQVRGAFARQYNGRSSRNENSKTMQVNATKSRSRTRNEISGSGSGFVATLDQGRKSSGTSSTEFLVETESGLVDGDRTKQNEPLPYKQILQRIQSQGRRKSDRFESEKDPPPYSECASRFRENVSTTSASQQNVSSIFCDQLLGRYPPIEEEPDSFDGNENHNK